MLRGLEKWPRGAYQVRLFWPHSRTECMVSLKKHRKRQSFRQHKHQKLCVLRCFFFIKKKLVKHTVLETKNQPKFKKSPHGPQWRPTASKKCLRELKVSPTGAQKVFQGAQKGLRGSFSGAQGSLKGVQGEPKNCPGDSKWCPRESQGT